MNKSTRAMRAPRKEKRKDMAHRKGGYKNSVSLDLSNAFVNLFCAWRDFGVMKKHSLLE
jgi:hypothetical protein